MPLYEYRCTKCGACLEKIQKFSDLPLTRCEKCGGKLERLISSSAIHFKGSGWYVTDYARKPAPAETPKAEAKSEGEAKKSSEPAKGKESKPAPEK